MSVDREALRRSLVAITGCLGLIGWLSPNALARTYGLDVKANPASPFLIRLFAGRQLLFAAGFQGLGDKQLNQLLSATPLLAAGDSAAALLASAKGQLPKRTAALVTATAVTVGCLAKLAGDDSTDAFPCGGPARPRR